MPPRRHLRLHDLLYQPKIRDWDGKEASFTFKHSITQSTLETAIGNRDSAVILAEEVAGTYVDELLADRPWRCCNCGAKATRLFLHPVPYLHLAQPTIADMPGPVCPSKYCEKAHIEQYRKGLGGVLMERVSTLSVAAAVAALMGLAALVAISVI
jgi:hypothetical protein